MICQGKQSGQRSLRILDRSAASEVLLVTDGLALEDLEKGQLLLSTSVILVRKKTLDQIMIPETLPGLEDL